MIETIFARRSIRQFTNVPVEEDQIKTLLEAAMAAPSASNLKPWHFVAVTDRATLDKLAEKHPHGKMLAQATLALCVCGDPSLSDAYWVQDCSAATQNILLAATALGLGSVWLGCHPRTQRKDAVRRVLGIPENLEVLSLVAMGHPAEKKESRTQYDEARVHRERW